MGILPSQSWTSPAATNQPVLGWDLRLLNVTSGLTANHRAPRRLSGRNHHHAKLAAVSDELALAPAVGPDPRLDQAPVFRRRN